MNIEFNTAEAILSSLSKDNLINVVSKPYYVNIFVFRKHRVFTNKFDDRIYWLWKDDNDTWRFDTANITSKPGTYYVKNPLNNKGVAILKPGFLKGSHKIGLHQDKYEALVQAKELTVYRDNDKDSWADYTLEDTGWFGINIHRANALWTSTNVDKWSAGCQVFANPIKFNAFMNQCKKHALLHENNFNLFLIG